MEPSMAEMTIEEFETIIPQILLEYNGTQITYCSLVHMFICHQ